MIVNSYSFAQIHWVKSSLDFRKVFALKIHRTIVKFEIQTSFQVKFPLYELDKGDLFAFTLKFLS